MKKLLFIALVATGLLFVPVQRSNAQITVGVGGVGVGVGYPGYVVIIWLLSIRLLPAISVLRLLQWAVILLVQWAPLLSPLPLSSLLSALS